MKSLKKILSLVLCVCVLVSCLSVYGSAGKFTAQVTQSKDARIAFGNQINDIIQTLVKGICRIYPNPRSWKSYDDFDGTYVYNSESGRKDYLTSAGNDAKWLLGYSQGSVIPDDFESGKYYLGRQLNVVASGEGAKAKGVLDDQRVRVVCMDDNTGKGAVVIAVIDGLGVTSATIRRIRAGLSEYVKDGRIAAVNVSATHCHSALDTQGVSTSFLYVLFANIFTNIFGLERAKTSNDAFIDNLVTVSVENIKKAYTNMTEGSLQYYSADISDYARDKRGYVLKDSTPKAGILHFIPDNNELNDTYLVDLTCHPTNVSANAGLASADYPYYMDESFKALNHNFIMCQGAVGQVSGKGFNLTDKSSYLKISQKMNLKEKLGEETYNRTSVEEADSFGEKITEILLDAENNGTETISPVLNAKYVGTDFTTDNYTLHLACQCRLVDNEVYTTGKGIDDVVLPSEIGYIEFGNRVAFGLFPCELYPEVFHGSDIITDPDNNYSWDGTNWNIPAANDMTGKDIDVYAVCFANDYIGYVVPDNFYSGWGHWALKGSDCATYDYNPDASIFDYAVRGTADQLLSAGKKCASQIMTGFKSIIDGINKN